MTARRSALAFLRRGLRTALFFGIATLIGSPALASADDPSALDAIVQSFNVEVRPDPIAVDPTLYPGPALERLAAAGVDTARPQYLVVVDRSPSVQALLIYFDAGDGRLDFIGAAPVSTGLPTSFDHFETPEGVFDHTPDNPDFRAEGTRNENGIRGYGVKGMRVFDLGWQQARGWPKGHVGTMRLQMHATDPDRLASRLGTAQSKGCIRIPARVNSWLDVHGILDAAYEAMPVADPRRWVLRHDRRVVANAGRYIVVLDSTKLLRRTNGPAFDADGRDRDQPDRRRD